MTAVVAVNRINKVRVDYGHTACETLDAVPCMEKASALPATRVGSRRWRLLHAPTAARNCASAGRA